MRCQSSSDYVKLNFALIVLNKGPCLRLSLSWLKGNSTQNQYKPSDTEGVAVLLVKV